MKLMQMITMVVYALKIIGLAPFSRNAKGSAKDFGKGNNCHASVFRPSKIGLAYNILLLIISQILIAQALPNLFNLRYLNKSDVSVAFDAVQAIVSCCTFDVILLSWSFRQNIPARVVNKLLEVDRMLSGLENHRTLPSPKRHIFLALQMMFNAFLLITLITTEGFVLFNGSFSSLTWIFTFLPVFVIYFFVIEYFLVVKLLTTELERVNIILMKLGKFPNGVYRTPIFNDYLAVLNLANRNRLATLQLLGIIRTKLIEVAKDIEEFFSFPMLLSIGCVFSTLVYNSYFLISPMLDSTSHFSISFISNTVSWIVVSVYPITLLSINVTKAGSEAKLTGQIVHKLMATPMRHEINLELKQFSLQLLHEQVSFTAYGFFVLDCTLLHSILGAVTTYLVILIQFQLADKTSNNPLPAEGLGT